MCIPSSNAACSCSFPHHLILRRVEPFDVVFVKIYSSCMHPWRVSEPMHGEITLTLFINAIQSVYKRVKSGEGPVLLLPLLHYSQSMYWIICQWQLQNKKLRDHLVFFAPSELVSINHHCFCLLDLYHTEQSLLI